jgi:hypothetical protein
MIESAYKLKPLKHRSYKLLEQAFEVGLGTIDRVRNIK